MKWILLILLIGGLAFAVVKRDLVSEWVNKAKGGSQTEDTDGGSGSGSDKNGTTSNERSGGDINNTSNTPSTPPKSADEIDQDIIDKYPLPEIKTLEEIVGNWNAIPPTAFPRKIRIGRDIEVKIGSVGSTKITANTEVFATGASNGILTVARSLEGNLKGQIPIDETNLKEVLTDLYDGWKKRKFNAILTKRKIAQRERNDREISGSASTTVASYTPPPSETIDPVVGKRPEQSSNGHVPVMIASIEAGDVTEIKLDEIDSWGPVRYEMYEGKPYWGGTVRYVTNTLFGPIDTEAMALIRGNKVLDWVYTGSGEEVP